MTQRKEVVKLIERPDQIRFALPWVQQTIEKALPGGPVQISLGRERRTLDQNSKLWPMLTDISKQVCWHGHWLTKEEWKDVMTAGLTQQKVVPGIEGGFVVLGRSTSRMKKAVFCELVELIYAFGAEQGVQWSEKAQSDYDEMMKARAA
jgi:hypothetical protein